MELSLSDLEDGRKRCGDSGSGFSTPEDFDMDKFYRGRQFYRDHLASCSVNMFFSLIIGLSIPEFLEALLFTGQSSEPHKATKRYIATFYHVSLWHYGNVWEPDSKAQKSVLTVRNMHKKIREQMQMSCDEKKEFLSQYDMGIVQSGFMGAVVMYPEATGIVCSQKDLDDYVYFWYGIGYLLGIEKKYNICAYGLSQAIAFSKEIEQKIVLKNLKNPPQMFPLVSQALIKGFQGRIVSALSFSVICYLSMEQMSQATDPLSFADKIRYLYWKIFFFSLKTFPIFKRFVHSIMEKVMGLQFSKPQEKPCL